MDLRKKFDRLNDRAEIIETLRLLGSEAPVSHWKGRPVIPVSKWEEMFRVIARQALRYIPDGFTDLYENPGLNIVLATTLNKTELEVWKEDYAEYLEQTSNPVRGRELCGSCMLKPAPDRFGLRRIIVEQLLASTPTNEHQTEDVQKMLAIDSNDVNNQGPGDDNDAESSRTYRTRPCQVLNRFKCPHKSRTGALSDADLVRIGKSVDVVEAALGFASELVRFSEVPEPPEQCAIEFEQYEISSASQTPQYDRIADLPPPRTITTNSVAEIHAALTTPEILDRVLDQYFLDENGSSLKHVRREIVDFVMGYKDKIRMQDLLDGVGGTLEDSDEQLRRLKDTLLVTAWKGEKCCICSSDICHIKCENCSLFMCNNHWYRHMEEKHPGAAGRYAADAL
jgi:hypothetical protein